MCSHNCVNKGLVASPHMHSFDSLICKHWEASYLWEGASFPFGVCYGFVVVDIGPWPQCKTHDVSGFRSGPGSRCICGVGSPCVFRRGA